MGSSEEDGEGNLTIDWHISPSLMATYLHSFYLNEPCPQSVTYFSFLDHKGSLALMCTGAFHNNILFNDTL